MKELWEYKLDLFFYGIQISKRCHEYLRKDSDGNVTFGDYITTRGLFILLNDTVSVNAMVNLHCQCQNLESLRDTSGGV